MNWKSSKRRRTALASREHKEDLKRGPALRGENAVEDNIQDYLSELKPLRRQLLEENWTNTKWKSCTASVGPWKNSIGYMLMVRCGLEPCRNL